MQIFFQQLVNGIALGSIYALVALGYTMVYGTIRLINFAHGDIFMVGAFFGFYLVSQLGMNVYLAMLLAMIFSSILGVIIERIAYKPLRRSTRVAALITAIGVSFLLQNAMIAFVGPEVKAFPSTITNSIFRVFGIVFNTKHILVLVITVLLMILLQVIVKYTKMGKAMRAVAVDAEAAQLMGINVDRVISFTFAIGSGLAGIAGVLVGVYYNSVSPTMGVTYGLKAFVAAVVGGVGSIPGAMVGGYLIGVLETLVTVLGLSTYREAAVYGLLIVILLVLPAGLFGKNVKEKV
ncbi:branched-chain amino acid ABC transporter permease [Aerococcaceae bacterium zg-ZJ1578]|uniref:branched-chain amino acid ABC transporter permease n=1 Tax=Aerococcaceae bacterium zg-252 TaxID=2796928 RepID=UPI001A21BF04|nr:branched-chain amino acid ABC transporter permease [Aerococcaceae bacterium zg-1578]MBR7927765.1 branched-chain amino acid ABC transporter permease [Aerococcaceae bacterium zg-ZUI334]MBS4461979.1 branched-chain amino acid ABC transporter permease [Aerococcaceae bacterium zg-B36]